MKIVIAIMKIIEIVNEKIARAASYLAILLILTLCYEVFARYIFGAPTSWSFDVTYFLCSLAMVLTLAYTWQQNAHVSVDMILVKFPVKVQALINVIFMITMFFLTWILIVGVMFPDVIKSWQILERGTLGSLPPIYPYKTWILIGTFMLTMQGINVFIKELYRLINGKELKIT